MKYLVWSLLLLCFAWVLTGCRQDGESGAAGFADPASCRECHEKEYVEWRGSQHDMAMQEANESTVLGDFNNSEFTYFEVTSKFYRKGNKFFVSTDGPDGQMTEYEIKYVFGVTPLQQYLIEFPDGKMQCLGVAWDSIEKRWFHLYPDDNVKYDDALHWTGIYQNWNYMCAECHSTDLFKNYDPETKKYNTTWREINVNCQACHGPSEEHVRWAIADKAGRPTKYTKTGQMIDMTSTSVQQVEACAPCHSRRSRISLDSWYNRSFYDIFMPSLLREPLYHADGQILDEVYVYASFLQSKMYHSGVRCTDCHNPHSTTFRAEGNALCVRCHQPVADEVTAQFSEMPLKDYDSEKHHFHKNGTEGSWCVDCHMIDRIYMVVDPRRDHSFRIPRPDLTVKIGTPNACNDCHDDQTAQWSVDWINKWYGPERKPAVHYGEILAAGRTGSDDALPDLHVLAQDSTQPAIVRASAVELMRGYPGIETMKTLSKTAFDPEPLVRMATAGCLDRLDPELSMKYGVHLLSDSLHMVRIEAARVLSALPRSMFSPQQAIALNKAIEEFKTAQMAIAEQPGAHLNLGVFYENQRQPDRALAAYEEAVSLVPQFVPARVNLARLYNSTGDNSRAEEMLRGALKEAPEQGEIHYSLGLLLAETNRLQDALVSLKKAAELLPERARVRYNYALALQHTGNRAQAEESLLSAHKTDTNDPNILNALVIFYSQDEKWGSALQYAEKLNLLVPDNANVQQMLEQLRNQTR